MTVSNYYVSKKRWRHYENAYYRIIEHWLSYFSRRNGRVADGDLAGAVSKAGGLGIIGGGNAPKEVVKANIDKIKSLTDKPFGVNIHALVSLVEDIVDSLSRKGLR